MTTQVSKNEFERFTSYAQAFSKSDLFFEQGLARIFTKAAERLDPKGLTPEKERQINEYSGTVREAREIAQLLEDREDFEAVLNLYKTYNYDEINKKADVRISSLPTDDERNKIFRQAIQVLDGAIQIHGLQQVFLNTKYCFNSLHEAEFLAQSHKQSIQDVETGRWQKELGRFEWRKTGLAAIHPVTLELSYEEETQSIETHLGSVEYAEILTGKAALEKKRYINASTGEKWRTIRLSETPLAGFGPNSVVVNPRP